MSRENASLMSELIKHFGVWLKNKYQVRKALLWAELQDCTRLIKDWASQTIVKSEFKSPPWESFKLQPQGTLFGIGATPRCNLREADSKKSQSHLNVLYCIYDIYIHVSLSVCCSPLGKGQLRDNSIQNFHLGRYIVGYTVGNLVLRQRASVAVKRDFRTYIRRYTSPNGNFEYGYPNSNAFLQFCLKLERFKARNTARHPTVCDVIIVTSSYFRQYITGYTVANF